MTSPDEFFVEPLGANPVNDEDFIALQTDKHLGRLHRNLNRSIKELQDYRELVVAEIVKRTNAEERV